MTWAVRHNITRIASVVKPTHVRSLLYPICSQGNLQSIQLRTDPSLLTSRARAVSVATCLMPASAIFNGPSNSRLGDGSSVSQSVSRRAWQSRQTSTCSHEISPTMIYLRNHKNGAEVFLVGTAHISKKSAEEVRSVIKQVRPDTVMVELCAERARKLMAEAALESDAPLGGVLDLLGGAGRGAGNLVQAGMGLFYKMWKLFGFTPGLEFQVAMQEARRLNAKVVYGDQEVGVTTKKLQDEFSRLRWTDLLLMQPPPAQGLGGIAPDFSSIKSVEDYIESIKTREKAREMMQMVQQGMPGVLRVIRDERDEFMVKQLLRCQGRVVGVVGLAHIDGIEERWNMAMSK